MVETTQSGFNKTAKVDPLAFRQVSSSQIRRLNAHLQTIKDQYDSLKIKQLSEQGTQQDAAKLKQDEQTLEQLRRLIIKTQNEILDIKLNLKWAKLPNAAKREMHTFSKFYTLAKHNSTNA